MSTRKRVGELLLEAGVIGEPQLRAALDHQRERGVRLGRALVEMKLATERQIVQALALQTGLDPAALDRLVPHALAEALRLVPRDFAVEHHVLPLAADSATLTVAMSEPSLSVADELRFRTGRRVRVCIAGEEELGAAIRRHYPGDPGDEPIALDSGGGTVAAAAPDDLAGGTGDASERTLIDAVERLARGAPALPGDPSAERIAMAALRTLLRRGVLAARDLAEELARR
jgi:type IV pilus assembly protein PilB